MSRRLSPREQLFVKEYPVDWNAGKAAIRAGYSPNGAKQAAFKVLSRPEVAAAIQAEVDARAKRVEVSSDAVLREVALILRSDVRDFRVNDDGTLTLRDGADPDAWRAVASVKHKVRTQRDGTSERDIEFRLWDKPAIARLAMQHMGMLGPKGTEDDPLVHRVYEVTVPKVGEDVSGVDGMGDLDDDDEGGG